MYYVELLSGVSGPGPDLFMEWTYQVINVGLTVAAAIAVALGENTQRCARSMAGWLRSC